MLQSRGLNLTVDFGHHTVAADKTAAQWGSSLFDGLFKRNWSNVQFIVEVANEDTYANNDWSSKMSAILNGVRTAWLKDPDTKTLSFPYSHIAVRRCPPTGVPSRFKIAPGDADSFAVETEYHFPENGNPQWNHTATMISNDGQIVYRPGTDPNPWAYNDGNSLRQVSLAEFKSKYGSRALLWHPALHRWSFKNGAYHATPKADANAQNETAFLSLLKNFLK